MPTASSATEPTDHPYALLKALLRGETAAALRLLEAGAAPGAAPPTLVLPAGNFTALHAAALGGGAAAIPALVAAGVPVNASLRLRQLGRHFRPPKLLRQLLRSCGQSLIWEEQDATPLAIALQPG